MRNLPESSRFIQVPEYPEPVRFELRSYVVMYAARENNTDQGFITDKTKMVLIPPDALIKDGPKSDVTVTATTWPRNWVLVIGGVILVVGLLVLARIFLSGTRRTNSAATASVGVRNSAPVRARNSSTTYAVKQGGRRDFPWGWVFGIVAISAIIFTVWTLKPTHFQTPLVTSSVSAAPYIPPAPPAEAPPPPPAEATPPPIATSPPVEPVAMPTGAALAPPPSPPPPPSSVKRLVGRENFWPVRFGIALNKSDKFFDTGIPLILGSAFEIRCTSNNCLDYVIRFGGHNTLLSNSWYRWSFNDLLYTDGVKVEPNFRSTIELLIRNNQPFIELEVQWRYEGCSTPAIMNTPEYNRACDNARDWAYSILERSILSQ